jgi:ABC-type transport system involved in multi-copper enzyme maturation permease subunit
MNVQIKALLIDTLKKELRNKTLIFALAFSSISIMIGYTIAKLFLQNGVSENEMTSSIAISIMFRYLNVWGVIISVFFGVSAVRSDFQNNIIYQYLSFPISRTTYFLTRLVGTWLMVFSFYLYSYIFTYILFFSLYKNLNPTIGQFGNIGLMGLYTFVYVTLTFIISMYLNRLGAFISMLFFSFLLTTSNNIYGLMPFADYFKEFSIMRFITLILYWLLPRVGVLSEIGGKWLGGAPSPYNLFYEMLHFILSLAFILFIGTKILKKKDF